jgi:hypothetical protein
MIRASQSKLLYINGCAIHKAEFVLTVPIIQTLQNLHQDLALLYRHRSTSTVLRITFSPLHTGHTLKLHSSN